MAAETTGDKNQPHFDANGAPEIDVDPTVVSDYAAKVGNRRVDTTAVRSAASGKDLWEGLEWYDTTNKGRYEYISGGWVRRQIIWLGSNYRTSQVILAKSGATPGWTDVLTVTASSTGGLCVVDWDVVFSNGNSGLNRTVEFQVLCDGVVVPGLGSPKWDAPNATGLNGLQAKGKAQSTPGAGSHTWKVQGRASEANACYAQVGSVEVREV